MYSRGISISRENRHNEPSFSSTLLDEIYRSIDDDTEDSKLLYRDYRSVKCQVDYGDYNSCRHRGQDEKMAGHLRRARLVDKWMLKQGDHENLSAESENKSFQDRADLSYFSSNSISSDSSAALSSSSDADHSFSSSTKPRVSCFTSARNGRENRHEESDDYRMGGENLFKSKSRALKIYTSLRNVKHPISPGGKLTSFINSLFNNEKKLKKTVESIEASSNCYSARPCLGKNSREKMRNGLQRRVRFDPVSVVFKEESRPRESKSIIGFGSLKFGPIVENIRRVEEDAQSDKKTDYMSYGFRKNSYTKVEEEDDDDAISDSSSELFELDHLSFLEHNIFCQQLPMYETTHHRVIRGGLITPR